MEAVLRRRRCSGVEASGAGGSVVARWQWRSCRGGSWVSGVEGGVAARVEGQRLFHIARHRSFSRGIETCAARRWRRKLAAAHHAGAQWMTWRSKRRSPENEWGVLLSRNEKNLSEWGRAPRDSNNRDGDNDARVSGRLGGVGARMPRGVKAVGGGLDDEGDTVRACTG
ncbi:hypothetical protein EDB84DRAFT_1437391 [Lactarius hengduanensis]|nr:hypothetical protein EDB84DRAFT_1437391 [Lactarius hengduanensis]